MPCSAPARGTRQTPPHTSPLAFNDAVNTTPCGRRVITSANSVAFADGLCLFHLKMAKGDQFVNPPYVDAA